MTTIIIFVTNVVTRTPVWVFPLIIAVVWLGSLGLRDRTVSLRLLFVLPVVLLSMSVGDLLGTTTNPLRALMGWAIAAAIGAALGWSASREPRSIDVAAGRIVVPGSVIPLLVCIGIVTWRYAFGYLYGRYPDLRADGDYALALIVGNTLLAGVMFGQVFSYGAAYWSAVRLIRAK
jgi:hypothetical protein